MPLAEGRWYARGTRPAVEQSSPHDRPAGVVAGSDDRPEPAQGRVGVGPVVQEVTHPVSPPAPSAWAAGAVAREA